VIDARRWAIVEAWLSLGLRIEWSPRSYSVSYGSKEETNEGWIEGGGASMNGRYHYRYEGAGVWQVLDADPGRRIGFPRPTSPQICDDDMRHELAHYLAATAEQRALRNFGIKRGPDGDALEERAVECERVIDAILEGANRIVLSAMRHNV